MSSRSRPYTGVNLVDGTLSCVKGKGGGGGVVYTVTAELKPSSNIKKDSQLEDGETTTETRAPNVVVQFESPWKLKEGMFYDVECRGENGEGMYLLQLPKSGGSGGKVASDVVAMVTSPLGRFGANGGVGNVKVGKVFEGVDNGGGKYTDVDVTFDALTPAMRELPRRVRARAWEVRGNLYVLAVQGGTGRKWEQDVGKYVDDIMGNAGVGEVRSKLRNRG